MKSTIALSIISIGGKYPYAIIESWGNMILAKHMDSGKERIVCTTNGPEIQKLGTCLVSRTKDGGHFVSHIKISPNIHNLI